MVKQINEDTTPQDGPDDEGQLTAF